MYLVYEVREQGALHTIEIDRVIDIRTEVLNIYNVVENVF